VTISSAYDVGLDIQNSDKADPDVDS